MSDNCQSCENLRINSPNFILNGVTGKECSSLQDNTGLNPDLSVLHDNCEDLHDINNCLIAQLGETLSAYDVCDIKDYLKKLTDNIYNTLKALICSDCGQWQTIECMKGLLGNMKSIPMVTNHRYSGVVGDGNGFYRPVLDNYSFNIFMDSVNGNDGIRVADQDYYVVVNMCADLSNGSGNIIEEVTVHASGTPYTQALKEQTGRHFATDNTGDMSVGLSTALFVPKGQYLKFHVTGEESENNPDGAFRVHQISIIWVPAFNPNVSGC